MHRLLQADVGAGKTAIAIYAMLVAVANGHQALIMTPTEADFANPEVAPFLEKFLRGRGTAARQRVGLFKLAWDLVGEQFGSRQLHYEIFYAGEPMHVRGRFFNSGNIEPYKKIARRFGGDEVGAKS